MAGLPLLLALALAAGVHAWAEDSMQGAREEVKMSERGGAMVLRKRRGGEAWGDVSFILSFLAICGFFLNPFLLFCAFFLAPIISHST